jgi:hypothetical protein
VRAANTSARPREALFGLVGRHCSLVDLTTDRSLKRPREGGRVTKRVVAWAVFDEHALDALAENVRQLVLVDEGHPGVFRLRRIREHAAERQGGDKCEQRMRFIQPYPPVVG